MPIREKGTELKVKQISLPGHTLTAVLPRAVSGVSEPYKITPPEN